MLPFDTVFQRARWGGQMSFKIILIRLNLNPANRIEGENQTVRQWIVDDVIDSVETLFLELCFSPTLLK